MKKEKKILAGGIGNSDDEMDTLLCRVDAAVSQSICIHATSVNHFQLVTFRDIMCA